MFLGHFGTGLAAKRIAPRVSLGTLFLLLGLLMALWLGALFGPPPPNERALALSGLAGWLVLPWGYWIDRHRTLRAAPGANLAPG